MHAPMGLYKLNGDMRTHSFAVVCVCVLPARRVLSGLSARENYCARCLSSRRHTSCPVRVHARGAYQRPVYVAMLFGLDMLF